MIHISDDKEENFKNLCNLYDKALKEKLDPRLNKILEEEVEKRKTSNKKEKEDESI